MRKALSTSFILNPRCSLFIRMRTQATMMIRRIMLKSSPPITTRCTSGIVDTTSMKGSSARLRGRTIVRTASTKVKIAVAGSRTVAS